MTRNGFQDRSPGRPASTTCAPSSGTTAAKLPGRSPTASPNTVSPITLRGTSPIPRWPPTSSTRDQVGLLTFCPRTYSRSIHQRFFNLRILLTYFCFTFQNYDNRVNRWRPLRTGCRGRTSPATTCRHTHQPGDNDPDRATAISNRIRRDPVAGTAWQTPHTLSTTTMRTTGPTTTWTSTWPAIQLRGAASYRSKIQWPQHYLIVHSCSSVFK